MGVSTLAVAVKLIAVPSALEALTSMSMPGVSKSSTAMSNNSVPSRPRLSAFSPGGNASGSGFRSTTP